MSPQLRMRPGPRTRPVRPAADSDFQGVTVHEGVRPPANEDLVLKSLTLDRACSETCSSTHSIASTPWSLLDWYAFTTRPSVAGSTGLSLWSATYMIYGSQNHQRV